MNISLTTDYITGSGDPFPYLEAIAGAGFTHIHWCHEWNTEYAYTQDDIRRIGRKLKQLNLALLDLHATEGGGVNWVSPDDTCRRAGVALVRNRMEMTAELGSTAVVMHLPWFEGWLGPACQSLDDLRDVAQKLGVRIALENLGSDRNWNQLEILFQKYPPGYIGLCYDSGHGNFCAGSVEKLESLKTRLIALHLHDNDGSGDQHLVPFYGTVDWSRITRIIAQSSYRGCISMESGKKGHAEWDQGRFLGEAHTAGKRLTEMTAAFSAHPAGKK